MHVHFLDPYRPRSSPVHHLDARIKFVLTLAFILTTALAPVAAWSVYILLFALVLCVEVLSDLGVGYVLRRGLLALPFVFAALPVIFTVPGEPAAVLHLGGWTLTVTQPGLERLISIVLKSWISVQAAILLVSSTPFPDLLAAMRAVRVPRLLVAIFGLMWRYLFVLVDEAVRLMRGRAARSGRSSQPEHRAGGSIAWRARVAGGMAGSLFLRAFERSERIYMAMMARGFDGEVRYLPLPAVNAVEWCVLIGGLVVMGALMGLGFITS
jgi:cobalt/nickel transport system permease protein